VNCGNIGRRRRRTAVSLLWIRDERSVIPHCEGSFAHVATSVTFGPMFAS
jgi:hypothetical protein